MIFPLFFSFLVSIYYYQNNVTSFSKLYSCFTFNLILFLVIVSLSSSSPPLLNFLLLYLFNYKCVYLNFTVIQKWPLSMTRNECHFNKRSLEGYMFKNQIRYILFSLTKSHSLTPSSSVISCKIILLYVVWYYFKLYKF